MNEELKIIISAQIEQLKQNVETAKSKISSFKQEVEKASANVDENFAKMGTAIGNGAKSLAVGLSAAGAALIAVSVSTAEYREEQAKLATAFEVAGGSAEGAKQTYNDLFRVLGDSGQATEAASHLAKLTTEEQALAEWTNICQGVYATFGDSLPIEGLTEAANETAKVGTLTGSLADALNWAGINEDAFNESLAACNTEAEREALIRETLSGLYSEAAATYEENNAQVLAQNEAQAKLQETLAALGAALAPVITAFTTFANEALGAVAPYLQSMAEQYAPLLSEALAAMAEIVGKIVGFVVENWGIISAIAAVITGIAAAIGIYNAVAAVKAAMDAAQVTTLGALIAAYAAQAAAMIVAIAPYALIVAAIAAVIAIIVVCVKHWDEITAAVKNAWENIKQKTQEAVDKVVQWFENLKQKAKEKIDKLKEICTQIFENIKQNIQNKIQAAKDYALAIFEGLTAGIKNKIETAKAVISNTLALIKAIFTGDFTAAKNAVLNIFEAIKTGIKNKIEIAKNTVKNVIDAIKGFFNFEWSLPNLKMPSISITGKFSLSPLEVPKFSISWNKLGGVFDKPTLFNYGGSIQGLGEDGAEAVVPLERNTQWLDKLASMLNERLGNNPVVLNVDGKVFAQTAVTAINQQTRQTGKLALNLV